MRNPVIITEYKEEYMIENMNIKEEIKMSLVNMCMSIGQFNININIEKNKKDKMKNIENSFNNYERKMKLIEELNRIEIENNYMDHMR